MDVKKLGLPQEHVAQFVEHLMQKGAVFGPKSKGKKFVFDRISSPEEAVLDYQTTILPPKKFFQPPVEPLFKFNRAELKVEDPVEELPDTKIMLGIHNYDMHGILRLDYAMTRGTVDEAWVERRKGWIFIGVSYEPDDFHFAPSVGIDVSNREGLDLFLNRGKNGYVVEVLTEKGEELVKDFNMFKDDIEVLDEDVRFHNRILPHYEDLPDLLARSYDHPVWQKMAERCFSCGSCTLVCPTCYCFDVVDELNLNLVEGERKRKWDSCQLLPFTEVAGGEVFRKDRSARVAHRIYRKFKYITDHYGKPFCVGCGRCTRSCTAKISITEIVNEIARGDLS